MKYNSLHGQLKNAVSTFDKTLKKMLDNVASGDVQQGPAVYAVRRATAAINKLNRGVDAPPVAGKKGFCSACAEDACGIVPCSMPGHCKCTACT